MVKIHKNSVLNYREKDGVDKFSLGIIGMCSKENSFAGLRRNRVIRA